jgi:hypothetical protein
MSKTSTGVVIVRYRILTPTCQDGISIVIYDEDKQVIAKKDIVTPVVGERCICRIKDFNQKFECHEDSVANEGLHRDLKTWQDSDGNFTIWLEEAVKRFASFPRSYSFCRYKIHSNEVGLKQ